MSIEIKAKKDAVWLSFDDGNGHKALLNLNNIVLSLSKQGFTRSICMEVLRRAMDGAEDQTP